MKKFDLTAFLSLLVDPTSCPFLLLDFRSLFRRSWWECQQPGRPRLQVTWCPPLQFVPESLKSPLSLSSSADLSKPLNAFPTRFFLCLIKAQFLQCFPTRH
jgi:hypothetical protein